MAGEEDIVSNHAIVSHEEWLDARRELLDKEKAFTRQCDEMSRQQRRLPWERVTKAYHFDGPDGRESLADLFDGRRQLVVYHFMFHPDDKTGCPHCSLRADGFAGIIPHLNQRDVTMVVVSRAPLTSSTRTLVTTVGTTSSICTTTISTSSRRAAMKADADRTGFAGVTNTVAEGASGQRRGTGLGWTDGCRHRDGEVRVKMRG
jgi:predicted dithiol-disulfide oxidoreductase (DUF899 family)